MRSNFLVLFALAAAPLLLGAPAQAVPLPATVLLSEMSTDTTPATSLDAEVTVELSGNDLKITIDNNTSGGFGAGDYDISEIWLNLSGVTVTSASPAGSGMGASSLGYDVVGPSMLGSLGTFSVGIAVHGDVNQNPDLITAGEQDVMITLSCQGGDCSGAQLVENSAFKLVAAKFINGGDVNGDPNDSAFGGSGDGGLVPEPGTLALTCMGLAGLLLMGRRR